MSSGCVGLLSTGGLGVTTPDALAGETGAVRDIILYLSCALAGKNSKPRPRMIRGDAAGEESVPIQDILVREALLST